MPIPAGFVSHIDLLDPLCYPGSGLIIDDLTSPSTAWNISASGTTYDGTFGALSLTTQSIEADTQLINTGTGPITIAGWIKVNSFTYGAGFNALPAVGSNASGNSFRQYPLYGATPNAVGVASATNVTSGGAVYSASEQPINTWCFVVIKKDTATTTSQIITYLNGAVDSAGSYGTNVTTNITYSGSNSYGLINGTIFGESQFPMSVSQFWMYNSFLSDADVLDLYNATKARYFLEAKYDLSDPACYPGTGNTIFDLSGNARDATKTGTVGFVSDGQASYLDLTGAGYFTSSSFLIPSVQNWTFTGWFYCDEPLASTGYYFLSSVTSIFSDPTYGGAPFIAFGWAVPSVWAGSATQNRGTVWAPVQANLTDWYYITYTSNGTNTELYINGVSVGTQNQDTRILGTNMNLRLGSSPDSLEEAVGKLAYAEMYSDCLTAGDVLALYNATASRFAPVPVPVAEYSPFDNASYPGTGNTWFDLTANNNDLALSNQTFATTPVKSFTFANGYASNPTPTNLPTNIFTIDAWIKFNSTSQQILYGVGKDVGGGGQEALLLYKFPGNGGKPYVEMGSSVGVVYFNLDPVIGQWYNMTWSADGTTTRLYVDGVLDNSGAQGGQIGATLSGIVLGQLLNDTGGPSGLWYSDASFGQFNIYNEALDAGTILQNYDDNVINYIIPGPTSNNVGGRQFAQGFNG